MPISCRRRETALCHSVMNTEHEDNIWRERRSVLGSAARGFRNRCPNCGKGKLLPVYLRPHDICSFCREPNGLIMAHDAPPYITILIVGHIIAPLMLFWENNSTPPFWAHYAAWMTAALVLTLLLLPRVKGAWIGLMWALRLNGNEVQ